MTSPQHAPIPCPVSNIQNLDETKNYSSKNELCGQKSEETSGVMSFTRWFRELRGKSTTKEEHCAAKSGVRIKEERRVKLNRTNSALPGNCKFFDHSGGSVDEDGRIRSERKIKESDKRRYSFNGGSSAKLSRNPRHRKAVCLMSDTLPQKSELVGDRELCSSTPPSFQWKKPRRRFSNGELKSFLLLRRSPYRLFARFFRNLYGFENQR
ncbi:hypothetical protein V9T40_005141 [Parthenolecanium corni]|uniref:Uncharacterized protein n=1 Tax=Parthenolecanium corni TaxID=536013 RepID=A0AAN9Y3Z3_9HEMI